MWHKHVSRWEDQKDPDQLEREAQARKRNFGFNKRYLPTLEISMKKQMYDELGGRSNKIITNLPIMLLRQKWPILVMLSMNLIRQIHTNAKFNFYMTNLKINKINEYVFFI